MVNLLAPFRWPIDYVRQFAEALFYVVVIRLGLWLVPYTRLDKWLMNRTVKHVNGLSEKEIHLKAEFIQLASRFVPSATCLTQALATRTILRRHGHTSALKFGVDTNDNGKLVAHAWIELNDRIVIGKNAEFRRYSVLAEGEQRA